MEKINLIELLNEKFIPLSFKKKGNLWITENDVLFKLVQLQKSEFSNSYYLNFGVKFKNLNFNETQMHVFNRLGSTDKHERQEIVNLLNLDFNMSDDSRKRKLCFYLDEKIISYFKDINIESDVIHSFGKWTSLNTVPLKVKEYLNL